MSDFDGMGGMGGPPPRRRGRRGRDEPEDYYLEMPEPEAPPVPIRADDAAMIEMHVDDAGVLRNHHGRLSARNRLTPEKYKEVIEAIKNKLPPELALRTSGYSKETITAWARLAEDDDAHPIYRFFIEDMNRVSAQVMTKVLARGERIASEAGDMRWHTWWLERSAPEFRAKVLVEVETQVRVQLEVFLDAAEQSLPPEHYMRLLEIAAAIGTGKAAPRLPPKPDGS